MIRAARIFVQRNPSRASTAVLCVVVIVVLTVRLLVEVAVG